MFSKIFSGYTLIQSMSQCLCVFVILAISQSEVYGQRLTDAEEAEILRQESTYYIYDMTM